MDNTKRRLELFFGNRLRDGHTGPMAATQPPSSAAPAYRKKSLTGWQLDSLGGPCMGTFDAMIARHIVRSLGSAAVIAASGVAVSAVSTSVIPSASAQCPDVQV